MMCCKTEHQHKPVLQASVPLLKNKDTIMSDNKKVMKSVALKDIMGQFDPINDPRFIKIPAKYSDRNDRLMQKEALDAFVEMWTAAKKDGIHLKIISATRNFNYQKGIWERKWTGKTTLSNGINLKNHPISDVDKARMILLYSSMPGTSRHHWGTDIDINAFNNAYFEKGQGKKVYQWLTANAHKYGYCQPYTPKGTDRPNGYEEEKWHWSYMPLAEAYLDSAREVMTDTLLSGFEGSHTAEEIGVVKNYIFGIHKNCKSWH